MNLESIMKKLSEKYGFLINKLADEISRAPSGSLYCKKEQSYFKWYHLTENGKKRTYIPKREEAFAASLASKMLKQKQLDDLKKEKYSIDQYLRHHNFGFSKEEYFLNNANDKLRRLVSLSHQNFDNKYDEWQNENFQTNSYKPELKRIRTLRGDLVRAKSEAIIADYLFQQHIPYRYECALNIDGHIIYPDFIVIHPITGDYFIIEHFGLMDDREYFSKYIEKMHIYAKSGYYPDFNLICFYETEYSPLNSAIVSNRLGFFLNI